MPLLPSHGIQSMLKEGHKHLSGLDEAVIKLSTITRTSLGSNGMNKKVINHLDKLFVTIVNELEVELLQGAEELINKAIEVLIESVEKGMDVKDKEQVVSAVGSKQCGQQVILCPLIADMEMEVVKEDEDGEGRRCTAVDAKQKEG